MSTTWGFKLLKKSGTEYVDNAGNEFTLGKTTNNSEGILLANDENGLHWGTGRDFETTEIGCFLVEEPVNLDYGRDNENSYKRYVVEDGSCGFFRKATLVFVGMDNALKHGLKTHKFFDGNKKTNSLLFYWAVMHADFETIERLARIGLYHGCSRCLAAAEKKEMIYTFVRGLEAGSRDYSYCDGEAGCCGPMRP